MNDYLTDVLANEEPTWSCGGPISSKEYLTVDVYDDVQIEKGETNAGCPLVNVTDDELIVLANTKAVVVVRVTSTAGEISEKARPFDSLDAANAFARRLKKRHGLL